jgi:hypothetical protein
VRHTAPVHDAGLTESSLTRNRTGEYTACVVYYRDGGDDMEPYISSFVSNLLCFFHFRLLGVLGRAGRIKEVDMGIRARMPDSQ